MAAVCERAGVPFQSVDVGRAIANVTEFQAPGFYVLRPDLVRRLQRDAAANNGTLNHSPPPGELALPPATPPSVLGPQLIHCPGCRGHASFFPSTPFERPVEGSGSAFYPCIPFHAANLMHTHKRTHIYIRTHIHTQSRLAQAPPPNSRPALLDCWTGQAARKEQGGRAAPPASGHAARAWATWGALRRRRRRRPMMRPLPPAPSSSGAGF